MIHPFERERWHASNLIAGIDEAGRGPLAGPCVVACVILPIDYSHPLINDSKQLSEKHRLSCYEDILRDAIYVGVISVSESVIDRDNIYQSTKNAMMTLAIDAPTNMILTDAMPFKIEGKEIIDLIHGDALSLSIAAASIVAKVTRDQLMDYFDTIYPKYGFAKHKGYPTRQHIEAIETYGILSIHRQSYAPIRNLNQIRLF